LVMVLHSIASALHIWDEISLYFLELGSGLWSLYHLLCCPQCTIDAVFKIDRIVQVLFQVASDHL
jgi:hypothetical protein